MNLFRHPIRPLGSGPEFAEAWYYKGVALSTLGRYADAVPAFSRSLELDNINTHAWFDMGLDLIRLLRNDEAITAFNHVLGLVKDYPPGILSQRAGSCRHR